MPGRGRPALEWLAVAVLCAVLAAAVTANGWLWRVDQAVYDRAMASFGGRIERAVLIVAIDESSLERIGRWPWPRAVHARLLERLQAAGAGPVAMDILFSEPDAADPSGDAALRAALAAHGRVALALDGSALGAPPRSLAPMPFADVASRLGHVRVHFDPDGIVRSVQPWERIDGELRPQLALALLELADPAVAARYPPDASGEPARLRIPFGAPPGAYERVSYADLLEGRIEAGRLAGRPIIVGAVASGFGDVVPTPTSVDTRPMPGVEVNAHIYAALRHGLSVREAPLMATLLAVAATGIAMLALIGLAARGALLAVCALGVALLVASAWVLHVAQLWLPPAGAVLGCALAYPLWSWRRLEATQRYLDEELAALAREAQRWQPTLPAGPAPAAAADRFHGPLAALRESASRQRQLRHFVIDTLEGLPTGVVVVAPQGEIQLHNRRAAALLGAGGSGAVLPALRALDWPAGTARVDGIPSAPAEPLAVELQGADGRALHLTVAALRARRDGVHGVVLTLDDITTLKESQQRREAAMQYLSHDLRAPLASILALVEAARLEAQDEGGREQMLERIEQHAGAALELTENLFRLARAEAADVRHFVRFDLAQIAEDAAEEAWALARAREIRLLRELPQEPESPVLCDPALLKRAVLNLLTNAIKFSPGGAEVRLRMLAGEGTWRLSVHDQGPGIAPEDQAQLFRRFGRVEKTGGRRVAGLGLGLMIVKTVVERHGGRVELESLPGAGSTFTLVLPRARA